MTGKKEYVIVPGAGIRQLELIQTVAAIPGMVVITIDRDPQAPGHKLSAIQIIGSTHDESAYIEQLLEIGRCSDRMSILIGSSGQPVQTAARIAQQLGIQLFDEAAALTSISKIAFRQFCNSHTSLPVPCEIATMQDNQDGQWAIFPAIVRPDINKRGKLDISIVTKSAELSQAVTRAIEGSTSGKAIIEAYYKGQDYVDTVLVREGRVYQLGILREIVSHPVSGPLRGTGFVYDQQLSPPLAMRISSGTQEIIKALEIVNTVVTVSWRLTDADELIPIEVHLDFGGENLCNKLFHNITALDPYACIIGFLLGKVRSLQFHKEEYVYGLSYVPLAYDPAPMMVRRGVEILDIIDYKDKNQIFWRTTSRDSVESLLKEVNSLWAK